MDESAFTARRNRLDEQYRTQQELRRQELLNAVNPYEAQLDALAQERADNQRGAYIRQQQRLSALPETLVANGINGGGAETSLLKIDTQYGNERNSINSDYSRSAADVNQSINSLKAKNATAQQKDQSDYYEKLAELAQELEEARQAAEMQARKEAEEAARRAAAEQAAAQKAAQKAAEQEAKQAAAAEKAAQKATEQEAKKTASASTGTPASGSYAVKQVTVQTLGGRTTLSKVDGKMYANKLVFDGSGGFYFLVSDQKMTLDELKKAIRNGEVYATSGPMDSQYYQLQPTSMIRQTGQNGDSVILSVGKPSRLSLIQMLRKE